MEGLRVKKQFSKILCCPDCKAKLELRENETINDEVKSGFLKCQNCKKEYKILNYIPVFIEEKLV
ncbi:MAG: Trm112 family protein [Elusimicrobiota bacterium]